MESDWRIADSDLLSPELLSQAGHDLVAHDPLLSGSDLMQIFFQNPHLTPYRTESGIPPSFPATCYSADALGPTSEMDFTAYFPVSSGDNLLEISASDFFMKMRKQELSGDSISAASDSGIYHHLPDLFSPERLPESETDRVGGQQPRKSVRFDSVDGSISDDTYTLDAIVRSYKLTTGGPKPNSSTSSVVAGREHEKRPSPGNSTRPSSMRRQRQGQRAQCLQKVLPCDRKMDMGTTLEEIYKYVRFLQAQVEALRSMPRLDGAFSESPSPGTLSTFGGGAALGKLTRQQLLRVVVNSPVAQTKMYSRACCVFSVEQLDWLRETAAKRLCSSDVDASKLH